MTHSKLEKEIAKAQRRYGQLIIELKLIEAKIQNLVTKIGWRKR